MVCPIPYRRPFSAIIAATGRSLALTATKPTTHELHTVNPTIIYNVSQKKKVTACIPTLTKMTDFQNSFTDRLSCSKFAVKPTLNFPPHLKHVAAVPCEMPVQKIAMFEN